MSPEQADLVLLGYQAGAISPVVGYHTGALSPVVGYDAGYEFAGYDQTGAPLMRLVQHARPQFAPPAPRMDVRPHHHGAHPGEPAVQRVYSKLPGIPSQDAVLIGMPLLASAFTATSGVTLPVNQAPTKGFRPRRLIYVETRTGATATGLVNIVTPTIGSRVQAAASGAFAAAQFAPNAFDCDVKWDDLQPGVPVTANVTISAAPTMTDRVDFSLSCNGESLS